MPIPLPQPGSSGPPRSSLAPAARSRSSPPFDPETHLRERLVSDLHMGKCRPGDRLPSIRQVARETRADHRAIARAYRALELEGLVEVQGRSGVRVARSALAQVGEADRPPVADPWLAEVLAQSWQRSVPTGNLRSMVEMLASASRLRCACVESNRDQMTAYCAEIGELTDLQMTAVYASPNGTDAMELARLRKELQSVDLVVTTPYHAATLRAALGHGGAPLVVLRINPELADAVRERLRQHGMTVVAATSEFGERLRRMYADVLRTQDQLRVVVASDVAAVARLNPDEPVLLTGAARELAPNLHASQLLFPHARTIAPDSMRELAEQIVRLSFSSRTRAS